jgi:hypothetical protein
MTWGQHRKFVIIASIVAVFLAVSAVTLIATLHHTPSCNDNIQNQGEAGVDCGGPCAYLCTTQVKAPVTLFARAITSEPGRTDVVALVQNQNNTAAAKSAPYIITLYSGDGSVLKTIQSKIDLPPAGTSQGKVAIFYPGALTAGQQVSNVSVTFNQSQTNWYSLYTDPRIVPSAGDFILTATDTAPRLTATLTNTSPKDLSNVYVVGIVYDTAGNVLAASQTSVLTIPADGNTQAVLTWNAPFAATAGRIEVIPVIPLP